MLSAEPDEEAEEEEKGEEGEHVDPEARTRTDACDVDVVGLEDSGEAVVGEGGRDLTRVVVPVGQGPGYPSARVDRGGLDLVRLYLSEELRVREVLRRRRFRVRREEQQQA